MNSMKALSVTFAIALSLPAPMLAATSADIEARGSAASFCNISNQNGLISMTLSAEGDKLAGQGTYSYVSNGNSKVLLSAVDLVSPDGAAASIPNISLEDLVSNNSSSAQAASNASGGVIRKEGSIATSITQSNATRLLTAGDYALKATATCTSL